MFFATHSVVARRQGANRLGIDFEEVMSCRRTPAFDQYAAIGVVPAQAQIEHGWQHECHHCSETVDQFTENPHFEGTQTVFCSSWCKRAEVMRQTKEHQLSQAIIEAACIRWPGITPVQTRGCGKYGKSILFNFPGSVSAADWTLGEDTLHVAVADHAAWSAFTGKPIEFAPYERQAR